jgi:hypothetical protein
MRIRTDLYSDYPCTHTLLPAFLTQMEVPEKRELLKSNICIDFTGCVCVDKGERDVLKGQDRSI